ncbi:uncharacterized protein KY384_007960 [Bacidia gigantensis]|uniref:uncharacterized protein n=1 Tax=Bacidia gigantensis TaxID=2732470 RepID=UPI001D0458F0|nr:uncharacterized protein KY384_007960 [Bacidia gigantensis]KAG8527806.1 hypothetical protein KY384_007960 [Bacidia gigantensis]
MTPHDSRLANGTVAGIVIGASIGLALITFLVTFLLMRRKKTTGQSKSIPAPAGASRNEKGFSSHPYEVSEASSSAIPSFLPQAADDRTVQTKAKTLLDQIELYVENFYQDSPKSGSKVASADLTAFNSPFLENALSTLLSQATRSTPFIKHGLAYFITTSLLPMENSDATLLPEEFITLPRALKRTRNSSSQKPGYLQAISQWRVLTAYLRPDSASDQAYIVQRDRQIDNICQNFLFAFAQWSSPRHGDDERVGSLVAILKDAANLGIFLQSQPVDLQFQFPTQAEVGTGKICIAPALVKTTDEKAQVLSKPQVLVNAGYQKV